jgi:hypothetical protein
MKRNNITFTAIGIAVMLFLVSCVSTPKNPEYWMEREINACLPTAIAFRQGLKRSDVWAEVFKYNYYQDGKLRGHAMVAYLYPAGANKLWTYDSLGSYRVRAYTNDVAGIAKQAHYVRMWEGTTFNAEFVK